MEDTKLIIVSTRLQCFFPHSYRQIRIFETALYFKVLALFCVKVLVMCLKFIEIIILCITDKLSGNVQIHSEHQVTIGRYMQWATYVNIIVSLLCLCIIWLSQLHTESSMNV